MQYEAPAIVERIELTALLVENGLQVSPHTFNYVPND